MALLQEGLTNDEIAERLGISESGARYHVSEILSKLGVASRYEAAESWQPAVSGTRFFGVAFIASLLKKLPLERTMKITMRATAATAIGVLVLFAIGILIMESRSGGAEELSLPVVNPETTVELLHGALLSPGDLPGAGWDVTEDDEFDDPDDYAPSGVCDGMKAVEERLANESFARVQRRLEFQEAPAVEVELAAFLSTDLASDILKDVRELPRDDIAACLTETNKRLRLDADAMVTPSDVAAIAPHDGVAFANDMDFGLPDRSRVLGHAENYMWAQKNVLVRVFVVYVQGSEDVFPIKEALTAALDAMPGAVDSLRRSN